MSGVGFFLRTTGSAQRRRLAAWVLTLVGSLAVTAMSVAGLYDTPAKIRSYGAAVVSDALVAINGRVEGIGSLGGIVQDEFGFLASFLMPLAGIALVASMTRAEEESGRLEALLAGRADRRAPVVAALLLVTGAMVVVAGGFVTSLLVAGIAPGPAVLYSLSLVMVSVAFASLAAVAAQLALHSRNVYACGFVAVGLSYLLRGVGDVQDTWCTWLSPLGWAEKTAPFADGPRWWVLVIPLAVALALSTLAVVLAGRRDVGSAWYRPGPGRGSASAWLERPIGLALHRQRGSFLAWGTGAIALAAVMGALTQELVRAIVGNASLTRALGVTSADATDGVVAMTEVYLALIACGYVVHAVGLLRAEEAAGRAETMLVGTVGRGRWLGAQLAVVVAGLLVLATASALVLGAAMALSGGSSHLGSLLGAGLGYVPAELVVAGVAFLLYGAAPRVFVLGWGMFGVVTFAGLLGRGLQLPRWVRDVSPLTHVGHPPEGAVDPAAVTCLVLVALGLAVAAFAAFGRRRIPQA